MMNSRIPDPDDRRAVAHQRDAVLYVRVSSKEQEKEGFSIPAQRKLLVAYAEEHGLRIVQEFEDIETAKRPGRPSFEEMVAFFRKTPTCQILLVEKTDRLYRTIKDWVTIADLDRAIHLVKEGVILSNDSRSSEKFMHGIRVLMAKNYIDNLSEEVRKGMREKAEQGHWPTVAHIGYLNNLQTKRIEVDPERGPLVTKVFEWYARGTLSLKAVTMKAALHGLTHPRSGRRLARSEIHRILHNPLYYGDFRWNGKLYKGSHQPLITRELFEDVQAVFEEGNRPRYSKHRHAFAGLVDCALCGCAMTAELKKGRYIYYHCTGHRGRCGNTYVREERLAELFEEAIRRVHIPADVAATVAEALKKSHYDKEAFHKQAIMRLQGRYTNIQERLERAYDDRVSGRIKLELWQRKSEAWERELEQCREDIARQERASTSYFAAGMRILELAKDAPAMFQRQNREEQAALVKTLVSNCRFDRGSLSVVYTSPFDMLARGNESGDWLGGRETLAPLFVPSENARNFGQVAGLARFSRMAA